jgi:cytidylate kinase
MTLEENLNIMWRKAMDKKKKKTNQRKKRKKNREENIYNIDYT